MKILFYLFANLKAASVKDVHLGNLTFGFMHISDGFVVK